MRVKKLTGLQGLPYSYLQPRCHSLSSLSFQPLRLSKGVTSPQLPPATKNVVHHRARNSTPTTSIVPAITNQFPRTAVQSLPALLSCPTAGRKSSSSSVPLPLRQRHFSVCHSQSTKLQAVLGEAGEMDAYIFPDGRLKRKMQDSSRTPLLLIACGSFSPITFLHLRMFVMADDFNKHNTEYEVIGGYLSPVSDAYKKQGLAPAEHRVAMCQLAIDKAANWLMVDTWEAEKKEYSPTADVLDHFDHEINVVRKGIDTGDGTRKQVRIALLAGADLIQTMSTPGVWSEKDLDHILGRYGTFIIERTGTDIDEALASLGPYRDNIHVIQQLIQNDVSSTKIRLFLKRGMSVQYLIPAPVVEYIEQNHLFNEDGRTPSMTSASQPQQADKGKAKEETTTETR